MNQVLSPSQMKDLDARTINEFGLPALVLMENAGRGCADFLVQHFPEVLKGLVIILHGTGNNSGDGFVIARWLASSGVRVVLLKVTGDKFTPESRANSVLCEKMGINSMDWSTTSALARHLLHQCSLIIDAVYGISFHGILPTEVASVFAEVNTLKSLKIAIDIPSGVNADTGSSDRNAFVATHTLAIHCLKTGHLLHEGRQHCGQVHRIPIGIPLAYHSEYPEQRMIDETNCEYPLRRKQAHKGEYGRVYVIGGSAGYTGSVALAAQAALRAGAGFVYLCSRAELSGQYSTLPPEIMFRGIAGHSAKGLPDTDKLQDEISQADAVLIGPGLGLDAFALKLLTFVLSHVHVPLIVDADAITLLAANPRLNRYLVEPNVLLTPHYGEFSRLTGKSVEEIKADTLMFMRVYVAKTRTTLLLKGNTTVFCDSNRMLFNLSGNDGLATGGSGDVLGGIIASFCAQGLELGKAAINASYMMGKTAEMLADKRSTASIIPSDIIANLFVKS